MIDPDLVSDAAVGFATDHSVFLAETPKQQEGIIKLRDLLLRLRKLKPPHSGGMIFQEKAVDRNGNVSLRIAINEGLVKVETVAIQFNILADDYKTIVKRLLAEYVALVEALWLNTYAPDLYIDDGSPVRLTRLKTAGDMDLT